MLSAVQRHLAFALAAVLIAPAACAHPKPTPGMAHALVDETMPQFRRPSLGGETIDTKALAGRAVVVKFFAKYCEPCRRTLPAVERLHESLPDVAFVGVAEDESQADVAEVVSTYGLTFPVVHDRANVLSGRFRVRELPVTFVVDKAGTIRWVGGPAQSEDEIARAVDSVR